MIDSKDQEIEYKKKILDDKIQALKDKVQRSGVKAPKVDEINEALHLVLDYAKELRTSDDLADRGTFRNDIHNRAVTAVNYARDILDNVVAVRIVDDEIEDCRYLVECSKVLLEIPKTGARHDMNDPQYSEIYDHLIRYADVAARHGSAKEKHGYDMGTVEAKKNIEDPAHAFVEEMQDYKQDLDDIRNGRQPSGQNDIDLTPAEIRALQDHLSDLDLEGYGQPRSPYVQGKKLKMGGSTVLLYTDSSGNQEYSLEITKQNIIRQSTHGWSGEKDGLEHEWTPNGRIVKRNYVNGEVSSEELIESARAGNGELVKEEWMNGFGHYHFSKLNGQRFEESYNFENSKIIQSLQKSNGKFNWDKCKLNWDKIKNKKTDNDQEKEQESDQNVTNADGKDKFKGLKEAADALGKGSMVACKFLLEGGRSSAAFLGQTSKVAAHGVGLFSRKSGQATIIENGEERLANAYKDRNTFFGFRTKTSATSYNEKGESHTYEHTKTNILFGCLRHEKTKELKDGAVVNQQSHYQVKLGKAFFLTSPITAFLAAGTAALPASIPFALAAWGLCSAVRAILKHKGKHPSLLELGNKDAPKSEGINKFFGGLAEIKSKQKDIRGQQVDPKALEQFSQNRLQMTNKDKRNTVMTMFNQNTRNAIERNMVDSYLEPLEIIPQASDKKQKRFGIL